MTWQFCQWKSSIRALTCSHLLLKPKHQNVLWWLLIFIMFMPCDQDFLRLVPLKFMTIHSCQLYRLPLLEWTKRTIRVVMRIFSWPPTSGANPGETGCWFVEKLVFKAAGGSDFRSCPKAPGKMCRFPCCLWKDRKTVSGFECFL